VRQPNVGMARTRSRKAAEELVLITVA